MNIRNDFALCCNSVSFFSMCECALKSAHEILNSITLQRWAFRQKKKTGFNQMSKGDTRISKKCQKPVCWCFWNEHGTFCKFQLYNFFNDAMSHLQSQKAPSKIGSMSDLVGSTNTNGNNIIEALSATKRPSSSKYTMPKIAWLCGVTKWSFLAFVLKIEMLSCWAFLCCAWKMQIK